MWHPRPGQHATTRRRFLIGLAATAAAGSLSRAAAAAPAGERLYYGVSGPFSGNYAEYGRTWKKAMAMAVDEINGAGGVQGRPIELVYEDTQSDPKQTVAVAQKFVNDSRILAELGDFASPASMAASPIYERAHMVQFGFTNSHPDFTKGGEFMFSTAPTLKQDAAFLAEIVFEHLGKRQAVLYRNTDWGKVYQDLYIQRLKDLGGQVVAVESYLEDEKDFRPLLTKVRNANPEVLVLAAYYVDGALLVQQARAVGLTVKIAADGACYSPQFLNLAGDAANGVLLTTEFFPGNPRPDIQSFVRAYRARYNEDPDQYAARSYDAVKIVAWATQAGGPDREAIQKALVAGTQIPSVVFGPFKFGPDRRVDNAKTTPIQVRNGVFTLFS